MGVLVLKRLGVALALGVSAVLPASRASAADIYWSVNTTHDSKPLTGVFLADVYLAPRAAKTADVTYDGVRLDQTWVPIGASNMIYVFRQGPGGNSTGQPVMVIKAATDDYPATAPAGGDVRAINTRWTTCSNANCSVVDPVPVWDITGGRTATGTPTPPVAAVPTLSEWALIFMGALLAGGAALVLHHRRPGLSL